MSHIVDAVRRVHAVSQLGLLLTGLPIRLELSQGDVMIDHATENPRMRSYKQGMGDATAWK